MRKPRKCSKNKLGFVLEEMAIGEITESHNPYKGHHRYWHIAAKRLGMTVSTKRDKKGVMWIKRET